MKILFYRNTHNEDGSLKIPEFDEEWKKNAFWYIMQGRRKDAISYVRSVTGGGLFTVKKMIDTFVPSMYFVGHILENDKGYTFDELVEKLLEYYKHDHETSRYSNDELLLSLKKDCIDLGKSLENGTVRVEYVCE